MLRIIPSTPDAREALKWIEERLGNGWAEWTSHRRAYLVDDLHIPCSRTRDGNLLMLMTAEGWEGQSEYVVDDIRERIIHADRCSENVGPE